MNRIQIAFSLFRLKLSLSNTFATWYMLGFVILLPVNQESQNSMPSSTYLLFFTILVVILREQHDNSKVETINSYL